MNKVLAGALAIATIAGCAATAKAESTCAWRWAGYWECNNNGVITNYYSLPAGPNTVVRPVPTPQPNYPPSPVIGPR